MRLADATTMRALDAAAIQQVGIPGVILMENAGRGAARLMIERWSDRMQGGVSVLCGRGNNGGDGYVIARHLHNAGFDVQIYLFADRASIQGDARINLAAVEGMKLPVTEVSEETWHSVRDRVLSPPVVVDALLGTGLRSEVQGLLKTVIEALNRASKTVLAVDIPSGLDASTGRPLGVAVRAQLTATFGLAKIGLVLDSALEYVGELEVVEISLPRESLRLEDHHDRLLGATEIARLLPDRPISGHKGTFGHLAVVAGSIGKAGAAILTCHAALRSGVGLVTLAVPQSATGFLSQLRPEVMLEPFPDEGAGVLTPAALPRLREVLERKDAMALGPGLSTRSGVAELVWSLLEQTTLPTVIDADGLNVIAQHVDRCKVLRLPLIFTPHPGETSRMLRVSVQDVQRDRVSAARNLAARSGATVVLKGARTLISRADGRLSVNPTGNPGMGTGGSGDVLTGLAGGLLAQGLGTEDAAVAAVYLHGLAGDLTAGAIGGRALVAGDIIDHFGAAFRQVAGVKG